MDIKCKLKLTEIIIFLYRFWILVEQKHHLEGVKFKRYQNIKLVYDIAVATGPEVHIYLPNNPCQNICFQIFIKSKSNMLNAMFTLLESRKPQKQFFVVSQSSEGFFVPCFPSEVFSFFLAIQCLLFLLHSNCSVLGRLPLQLPQRWLLG